METLNYEDLVSDYNNRLVSQLRNHAASVRFLEMWVPDEDPCRSIFNMAEAAQAYGQTDLCVRVKKSTLSSAALPALRDAASQMGTIALEDEGVSWLISIGNLR
jgi:hypothetical protein